MCVCVGVWVWVCVCGCVYCNSSIKTKQLKQKPSTHCAMTMSGLRPDKNKISHLTQASILLQQHTEVVAAVASAVILGEELLLTNTILVLNVVVERASSEVAVGRAPVLHLDGAFEPSAAVRHVELEQNLPAMRLLDTAGATGTMENPGVGSVAENLSMCCCAVSTAAAPSSGSTA